MNAFLAMGGYGVFVWPAFGVSLIVLVALAIWTMAAERKVRRELARSAGRAP